MKKRKLFVLLTAVTAGSFLLLNGCGVDLTTINEDETTLSAEMETENLSDGNVTIHSVWYNTDNSILASANITLSDENGEIFSGTTDESGNLGSCILPGNSAISCEITDSTGASVAKGDFIFKISDEYENLTIYTVHENEGGNTEQILDVPSGQSELRAAIFVTEDGRISFSNLSPYSESADNANVESDPASSTDQSTDETAEQTNATGADQAAEQTTDPGADQTPVQ